MLLQQKPEDPDQNIQVREVDVPSPAADEVLLQVICRPINPAGKPCVGL